MSAASDAQGQDMIPPEGTELIERMVERDALGLVSMVDRLCLNSVGTAVYRTVRTVV